MLRLLLVCSISAVVVFLGGHLVYAVTVGSDKQDPTANSVVEYLSMWRESNDYDALHQQEEIRRQTKQGVIQQVIDRRITLVEAIGQFRDLHPEGVDQMMPGRNDDERLGLCVIRWVRLALYDCPSREAELIPELEKELDRHLQETENTQPTEPSVL